MEVEKTSTALAGAPELEEGHFPTGFKLISILASLVVSYFLVFLDGSIMSTVSPAITTEFDSLVDIGWYGSAYQVGATAFQPLSGKIYRYFSVKWSFVGFFLIFEIGSVLCAAAQSSRMLIVGRAIAGVGSAGIFAGTMTTVANILPLQKRPAIMGINTGIGQLGVAFGPIIGGAFTSNASWRWAFYLNLFLGVLVAAGFLFNTIPESHAKQPAREVFGTALKSLDLVGMMLVAPAVIMFLLALEYGGNEYAWNSSVVIGLLVGAAVTFAIFLVWEHRQGDGAMIPFAMMRSLVIASATLTLFFRMGVILVADYYLAIFFQAISNDSPLMSGVHMLPATLGLVVAAVTTGFLTQATGYYLPWIIAGISIATSGYGALSTLSPTTPTARWIGFQILYGIGSGTGAAGPFIAIQNLVPLKQIPTAMAMVLFGQNLGGSVFLVVANAIFNNSLRKQLQEHASRIGIDPNVIMDAGARSVRNLGLPATGVAAVVQSYANAVDRVMYLGIAAGLAGVIVSWGMGNSNIMEVKKLKELTNEAKPAASEADKQDTEKQAAKNINGEI
ncbi:MFS general substrate transporter [Cryphonectria parasitica EP155]|uniref:MFS general substrate transporter n=1 Tax=Cryphonectria parasitica (strain ATCC 38755 / EP155) TaxID=660469 RepID=A0A9P4Y2C6_CRYP1|nr:MFS general substrate transporter [Cryphonectria parasitica EP155]KAF3765281.1 MFS general substrate transporter [Cryphonectria parasitica EP155]